MGCEHRCPSTQLWEWLQGYRHVQDERYSRGNQQQYGQPYTYSQCLLSSNIQWCAHLSSGHFQNRLDKCPWSEHLCRCHHRLITKHQCQHPADSHIFVSSDTGSGCQPLLNTLIHLFLHFVHTSLFRTGPDNPSRKPLKLRHGLHEPIP